MLILERHFAQDASGRHKDSPPFDARLADVVITVPPSDVPTTVTVRCLRPKYGKAVLGFVAERRVELLRAELVSQDATERKP